MAIHDSAILKYTITYIQYIFAKIQKNLDTYLFLIFKKLVEKYFKNISKNIFKNTTNISNITKYDLQQCRKPKTKPYPALLS